MQTPQISDPATAEVFSTYPAAQRNRLLELRELVFATSRTTHGITGLTECLKWQQPSFIAQPKGIGSTIRIDRHKDGVAMFFICTTGLVNEFRQRYADVFRFEGNRALLFGLNDQLPEKQLSHCIALALTYHKGKKS